jgi:hypothetical protein
MTLFTICVHILLYINRYNFNSHSVNVTDMHNLSVVVSIWAPIILVSFMEQEEFGLTDFILFPCFRLHIFAP